MLPGVPAGSGLQPVVRPCWQAARMTAGTEQDRTWRPDYPVDAALVLSSLQRGPRDPAHRIAADGSVWRAGRPSTGPVTYRLTQLGPAEVRVAGLGAGRAGTLGRRTPVAGVRRRTRDLHSDPSGAGPRGPGTPRLPGTAHRAGGRGTGSRCARTTRDRVGRVRRLAPAADVARRPGTRPGSGRHAGSARRRPVAGGPDLGLASGRGRPGSATGRPERADPRRRPGVRRRARGPSRGLPGPARRSGHRSLDRGRGRFAGAGRCRCPTRGRLPPAGAGRDRAGGRAEVAGGMRSRTSSSPGARTGSGWSGCSSWHLPSGSRGAAPGSPGRTTALTERPVLDDRSGARVSADASAGSPLSRPPAPSRARRAPPRPGSAWSPVFRCSTAWGRSRSQSLRSRPCRPWCAVRW